MRVSQVEIEPVLQRTLQAEPGVEARWGVAFDDLCPDEEGVTATLRRAEGGTERVRCRYLVGCDGGGSQVRGLPRYPLEGQSRVVQRFMTHFRSTAPTCCSALGWRGTTSRQRARLSRKTIVSCGPCRRAGRRASHPRRWTPRPAAGICRLQFRLRNSSRQRLDAAPRRGRILRRWSRIPRWRRRAPIHSNWRLRYEHRHRRCLRYWLEACGRVARLRWPRLARFIRCRATPIGLRNREASRRHSQVRAEIAALYNPDLTAPDF